MSKFKNKLHKAAVIIADLLALNTTFNDDGSVKEYGIAHANKRSIELGKKDISNLDKFLVDYTKFYKG